MAAKSARRSVCPVAFALDLFGDRWTLLIIRDLAIFEKSTYGEFLAAGEGISTNILADRLKRLEAGKLVTKSKDPGHGNKYIYRLTRKGLDLIPVMVEMIRWSSRYDRKTPVSAGLRKRLERDTREVVRELTERARAASKSPRRTGEKKPA